MEQMQEYIHRILKVLIYIESHLENRLTMEELAKVACYSPFHFHRIFQAVMGEAVHKYVRRLRLEKAAEKLRYTEQPITHIALDANYDTPSAFTKVFKQWTGKAPNMYRKFYQEGKVMAQNIQSLTMITPKKITNFPHLNVLFIRRIGNYVYSSQHAWEAMFTWMKQEKLNQSKLRYISISHDNPEITEKDKLRFDACIYSEEVVQSKGEVNREMIKGGKYAVFIHQGPHDKLQESFNRIFLKWLPSVSNKFDDARLCFCEHFNLKYLDQDESKLITDSYIPVI